MYFNQTLENHSSKYVFISPFLELKIRMIIKYDFNLNYI